MIFGVKKAIVRLWSVMYSVTDRTAACDGQTDGHRAYNIPRYPKRRAVE